jgi:predicted nucleic acid-binding protein
LVDTSVLIKWFHQEGETEVAAARVIRDAHARGDLQVHILDLAVYEIGNVLVRALRWDARRAADQLDDLLTIVGMPLRPALDWLRHAAALAEAHTLSYYDASWAATAEGLGIRLVSADRRLRAAALAESPSEFTTRLRLGS